MRYTHTILVVSSLALTGCVTRDVTPVYGSRCNDNICLIYHLASLDTDQDGVSDADEIAAGTDPRDARRTPSANQIVKVIAEGRLPSFSKGFSEMVVLPTKGPHGKDLLPASISVDRPSTLESLGISQESLSRHGIKQNDGFSILNAFPGMQRQGSGSNPIAKPPLLIGRINMALYSAEPTPAPAPNPAPAPAPAPPAERDGVDMDGPACMGCDGSETNNNPKSWWDIGWEFVFGENKKKTMTDPDAVPVVMVTPETLRKAWFKANGGTVSRPTGPDGPEIPTGPEPDTTVVGTDPNGPIILINPDDQDGTFPESTKLILLPLPSFYDKRQENTTSGPNRGPDIINGIKPGSGTP
jgi:hypothetical protein